MYMVPKVRLELTRLATEAFEAPVSAIPPLGLGGGGGIRTRVLQVMSLLRNHSSTPQYKWCLQYDSNI